MNVLTKAGLLLHILRWRLTWTKHDPDYRPDIDNPKFMSARDAVKLIADNSTVMTSGMAANSRCMIFYMALKQRYLETGSPKGLTWVGVGAMGSRGRIPGTLEELNFPGMVVRYVGGHLETIKSLLRLADEGHIELHNLPQGVMAFILEAQARGEDSVLSEAGIGTFLDPRSGNGSAVLPGATENFIAVEGGRLRYRLPRLDAAMFVAPYADKEGNIYIDNAATITENRESALAAKANNGKVLVSVSAIVDKVESKIFLPADQVDAVVVNKWSEQTGSVQQRRYWPLFTVGADVDRKLEIDKLRFMNNTLKITPVRKEPEQAMARLAASLFTEVARPGDNVNIGVGLPEEVCRLVYEGGLHEDLHFATETGVYGGLPACGVFFGAAVGPEKMMSSAEIFHFWEKNLDITVLGLLEADSEGNVNVSRRGTAAIDYVGAGGFPNLVHFAKSIIFIGTWMAGAEMEIEGGKLRIKKTGAHKFMPRVSHVTFSGKRALELGKKVYYVTNVGVFRLTARGMELMRVMPGVDVKKDILDSCPMRVALPEGELALVPNEVVTGQGFKLSWPK